MHARWSRAGHTIKKRMICSRWPADWGLKGVPLTLILACIHLELWVQGDYSGPGAPGYPSIISRSMMMLVK